MRDLDSRHLPSRVRGRPALARRVRGLALAVQRYGRHRARTPGDVRWAATMIDGLLNTLARADAAANGGTHAR